MEDLENVPSNIEQLPSSGPPPRRRRGGGMSAESFLASLLLHLAALFLVILYAPDRPSRDHDTVLLNIADFVLPEQSAPASEPAAPDADAAAPVSPSEAAKAAVQIPERDVAAAKAPPKAPEEAKNDTAKAETPRPEAPPAPAPATPPVPESSLPHGHGEYDPFEVYKAALAERVNEVLVAALDSYPILRAFRGKLVVHLYLDQQGRLRWFTDQAGLFIKGAAICLHHRGYQIYSVMPMPDAAFQRHCEALDQFVVKAINDGGPYPAPPPGLDIDSFGELSYVFDLPERQSQGVRPTNVPRVGPSAANTPP